MKLTRPHLILTALVVGAGIVCMVGIGIVWVRGFWLTEVFHNHKSNEPNRAALLQVRDAIAVGASHADVLAAYWQHRTEALKLVADGPAEWIITMPLEFGASDWTLRIEFRDGRVTAVRVRTSDGPPPEDGPRDKQENAG